MKINWKEFNYKFKNWCRINTFKPNRVTKSFQVMRNAMFLQAPHAQQPAFVKLFGPIDPKYLTADIESKCFEIRDTFVNSVQPRKQLNLNPVLVQQAVDLTNDHFGISGNKFRPASLESAAERLPGETSSGAPDYEKPKRDELPKVLDYLKGVCVGRYDLPHVKYFWPMTLFWRTQMRASGEKHRLIVAFPQVISVLEMTFAQPFFEHFERNVGQTWYSYGCKWYHNAEVWSLFQKYPNTVEIDYKSFDQSVHGGLIFLFYENLRHHLVLDDLDSFLLDYVRDYHIFGNVITSFRGRPYVVENKENGVASGSVFTSFCDSWVNAFVLNYAALELGYDVKDLDIRVMGDDTLIGTNYDGYSMLAKFTSIIRIRFGMIIGPDSKVRQNGEPLFYMGFLFTDNFKYMSEDLLKRKMTFTGRFIPEDDLPNKMVVWSKFCSICSVCSNGYTFWLKHKSALLDILQMDEPQYFHDLTEGPNKPFSLDRIIGDVHEYVREAWMFT